MTATELHDITWDMMTAAGLDTDLIDENPTGKWYSLSAPGLRVDFGPATTETGEPAEGWDITSWTPAEGGRENESYEYAATETGALSHIADLARTYSDEVGDQQ